MSEGTLLEVDKSLYGMQNISNRCNAHLSHILRLLGFEPTHFYPDFWNKGREGGYDCISTHNDDVLVVAIDTTSIFNKLKETYTILDFCALKFHLGCDYPHVKVGASTWWVMGSSIYTSEALHKACMFLKATNLQNDKLPISTGDHHELYPIPLLGD